MWCGGCSGLLWSTLPAEAGTTCQEGIPVESLIAAKCPNSRKRQDAASTPLSSAKARVSGIADFDNGETSSAVRNSVTGIGVIVKIVKASGIPLFTGAAFPKERTLRCCATMIQWIL